MSIPRDLHLLSPTLTHGALDAGLRRAVEQKFRAVVVPPIYARHCVEALRGSGVRVTGVVGFPLGLNKATVKAIEATGLAKDGVDAVEVTPLAAPFVEVGDLVERLDRLRAELLEIVRGVRAARPGTAVHVRLDVDRWSLDADGWADVAGTLVRSACDGAVLAGTGVLPRAAVDAFATTRSSLERKVDASDAREFDATWVDAIGVASL